MREARGASTGVRLITAARELIAAGGGRRPSAGAIAARAGLSRLTVYHHFGSLPGLLDAVAAEASQAPESVREGLPVERLHAHIAAWCSHWATDPALYRNLAPAGGPAAEQLRQLAADLAAADRLRPGCSLREAEDVIAVASSFAAFDRLHQGGRRSASAVSEILMRMAASIVSPTA